MNRLIRICIFLMCGSFFVLQMDTKAYATDMYDDITFSSIDEELVIEESDSLGNDNLSETDSIVNTEDTEGVLLIEEDDIGGDETGENAELLEENKNNLENTGDLNGEEVLCGSVVEVNPIYEEVISEEELYELIAVDEKSKDNTPGLFYSAPSKTFASLDEIATYLKTQEISRDSSQITLKLSLPMTFDSTAEVMDFLRQAIIIAESHTGKGNEGDYLRYNRLGQGIGFSGRNENDHFVGEAYYTFSHFTNSEQEDEITSCLNEVYSSLNLNNKTVVEKVLAIYGYITEHVTYDWDNVNNNSYLLKHSTYAALINGTAVCQGYATLLYRMLLDFGIDSRVITGDKHAWNIVGLGTYYYNLDSTWDSNVGNEPDDWEYFLKCENEFPEHSRDIEYMTVDFTNAYPMSDISYDCESEELDPDYPSGGTNGICIGTDGEMYLYENGEIKTEYYGLYNDDENDCTWLIRDGIVQKDYYGLYEDSSYGWWLVENGKVNYDYNDLYYDQNVGWWKIAGGTVDFGYTGLYDSLSCGWWLIFNGSVAFDYSDLYCDAVCGWWKVYCGAVDFGFTDLYNSPSCGWWKVNGGMVDFGYSDLYDSPSCGWWKVNEGYVDFGYSDLYNSPSCGWWKVNEGYVDFGFTDLYNSPSCGWWKVNGGMVDFGYSDLYDSPIYGWWLVSGGYVNFDYSDIFCSPIYGYWKVNAGNVDFAFNGVYNSRKYGQCYVTGGAANF